MKNTKTCSKCN